MLQAKNLSIGYAGHPPLAQGINLSAQAPALIALLGVNGIGKSTLLRTLAGLQPYTAGEVLLNNQPLNSYSVQQRATQLSVVTTERVHADNLTVYDFLALGRFPYTNWLCTLTDNDKEIINNSVVLTGTEKFLHKFYYSLSDGEKQKVNITRALCQQTPIMILDEPTAFLDFKNKEVILKTLHNVSTTLNKLVILSTHDLELAFTYCNHFWLMTEGRQLISMPKQEGFRDRVMAILK